MNFALKSINQFCFKIRQNFASKSAKILLQNPPKFCFKIRKKVFALKSAKKGLAFRKDGKSLCPTWLPWLTFDLVILKTFFKIEPSYFKANSKPSLQHVLQPYSTVSQILQATGQCVQVVCITHVWKSTGESLLCTWPRSTVPQ
jgi:hypothetical protein